MGGFDREADPSSKSMENLIRRAAMLIAFDLTVPEIHDILASSGASEQDIYLAIVAGRILAADESR